MNLAKLKAVYRAARPNQWLKNLIIFTSLIFSGQLFNGELFLNTLIGFVLFCLLSSVSYILNDIIDYPFDKKHPSKKFRPIASGELSVPDATFVIFATTFIVLISSLFFSIPFFFVAFAFLLLHFFYSLYFKMHPVLDIFTISFSFMLRAFAGSIITGYHIQIWLLLTVFFISLFIATVKRHAELVNHGTQTRSSLYRYKEHLIDFLTTTFATLTITSYSLYTFLEKPPIISTPISQFFSEQFPMFEARKWIMVTVPIVVYGIARYAQLLYEKEQGESPETIITKDKPLIAAIVLWGAIVIGIIYLF